MKKITKHVFETSDGKAFDVKADAEKHEAGLGLEQFFGDVCPTLESYLIAEGILDNLDAFAEIIRPLIRKPRKAKAEAQADSYQAAMAKPAKGKAA